MKLDNLISVIVVLAVIGFSWFIIKQLFFYVLIAGGAYLGYKLLVENKSKQIDK